MSGEKAHFAMSGYSRVPGRAAADKELSGPALRLLVALGRHVDAEGRCYPSLAKLAVEAALRRQKVPLYLAELERRGYLDRSRRHDNVGDFTSTLYTVNYRVAGDGSMAKENGGVVPQQGTTGSPSPGDYGSPPPGDHGSPSPGDYGVVPHQGTVSNPIIEAAHQNSPLEEAAASWPPSQPHLPLPPVLVSNADVEIVDEPEAMMRAYNVVARRCGLAIALKLSAGRRSKAKARLRDIGGLDAWAKAMAKLEANAWMHGETDRGWAADFPWLLKPENLLRLVEGGYDDRRADKRTPQSGGGAFGGMMRILARERRNG